MLFPFYVKNNSCQYKRPQVLIRATCGLCYARVIMALLLAMKHVTMALFALDYARMFVTVRQQDTTRW